MNNKIILYLHFHKCGGTSINSLFKNYKKHNPNLNGNPWNKSGIIDYWNYNKNDFNKFKNYLIKQRVNFISLEWNFFKYYSEIDFRNVELIVSMRDPYNRYISNMKARKCNNMYDFNKRIVKWNNKRSKQKFYINYNKFNYYTKMLNGFGDKPNMIVNDTHLEIAKKNLFNFNTIIILEDTDTFKLLEKYNIFNIEHKNKNKNKDFEVMCELEEFKKYNNYDYELYNYALELNRSRV